MLGPVELIVMAVLLMGGLRSLGTSSALYDDVHDISHRPAVAAR